MHRLALNVAVVLALIACLAQSDAAQANGARHRQHSTFGAVACRPPPPPWYRGFEREAPFVCADFWWSPYYYYRNTARLYHYRGKRMSRM